MDRSLDSEYSQPDFRSMNIPPPRTSRNTIENAMASNEFKKTSIWPNVRVSPMNPMKQTITRQKWDLRECDVKSLPRLYPLDRSHVELKDYVSVPIVCKQITESMRIQNIAGLWDRRNPNTIRCDSEKMLLFEINVWKKSSFSDKDNDDDGCHDKEQDHGDDATRSHLVVEIHYLSGDVLEFHRVKSNLFAAINGQGPRTLHKHCRPPLPNIDEFRSTPSFDMASLNETLSTTKELYEKGGLFNRKIALEMLTFGTDTSITNCAFATQMSAVIVLGLNPDGQYLREVIRSEITNFENESLYSNDLLENMVNSLHREALKLLGNALQLVSKHYQNQSSPNKIPHEIDEFWIEIIPNLIDDLDHAITRPHMANAASRCLRSVYKLSHSQKINKKGYGRVNKEDILPVVERALIYGKENYISLEKESLNLMMVLSH